MEFIASEKDVLCCQFHCWYDTFRQFTMKSQVIDLSSEFISYLGEDSLILPSSTDKYFPKDQMSDDEDDKLCEVNEDIVLSHQFSELEKQIIDSIRVLDGEVFIKLNWSAPSDAIWMNGGTMKCRNVAEILLLLKSSDRITFDIEKMIQSNQKGTDDSKPLQYKLVLRKWANLSSSMEFRVFVVNNSIFGICQRDCSTYYDFLADNSETLCDQIEFFYNTNIKFKFSLTTYTFDVYIDKKNKVWLLDFNPFGDPTSALLFEWNDFARQSVVDEQFQVEFRLVENEDEVLPSPAGSYRGPVDVQLSHEFPNFMKLCKENGDEQSDSETE